MMQTSTLDLKGTSRRLAQTVAIAAAGLLATLAARAESTDPSTTPATIALDIGVGLAFIVAAALAPASWSMRIIVAGVGVLWLLGSIVPATVLAHQTAIAVMLVAFPVGRPSTWPERGLIAIAVPVAFDLVPLGLVAVLFGAIAVAALLTARGGPAWALYPGVAAMALAATIAGAWLSVEDLIPLQRRFWFVAYPLVLIAIATGFLVAARMRAAATPSRLIRVLSDERVTGLEGLTLVLRDVLDDPGLRILRADGVGPSAPSEGRYPVDDEGTVVGVIVHASQAMADPSTAEAAAGVVRLAIRNARWQDASRAQLAGLEAARARLVAAADRQRAATAGRLRAEVVAPIDMAIGLLREARAGESGEAVDALSIAEQELTSASKGIADLGRGVAPGNLGGGGLREALHDLVRSAPLPVVLTIAPDAQASPATETALYYVCSEALANAIKHAGASAIAIDLRADRGSLVVTITDDGAGGADPTGSGLQGLADRVATRNGRLRVESPPGAGTTVTAWVPA
jgi:signal transduction histidine kinase